MRALSRPTFWVYVLQFGGLPLSAALLPLLLWRFSAEQLGLWYLMLNLGQLAAMAEGAIEPSLTRYLTYARSGVQALPAHGQPPGEAQGSPNAALCAEVVGAAHWLYRRLGACNLALVGLPGGMLLAHVAAPWGDGLQLLFAWGLYVGALALGTRWMAAVPLLQGSDRADAAFRALAVQRLVFGLVAAAGLAWTARLEVLGVAQLAGVLLGLGPAYWQARRLQPWPAGAPGAALRQALWQGGGALWLGRLGGYLVVRANVPLVSAALGLGPAGRLALTLQLIDVLTQLSQAPMFASLPRLYELHARGQRAAELAIVGRVFVVGWATFLAGGLVLWWGGDALLAAFGRQAVLLPALPLAVALLAGLLELNFNISTTLLMVGNGVPFVRATLLAGVGCLALNALAFGLTPAGLLTAVTVPLLVQSLYNYWKWPRACLRLFETRYPALVRAAWPGRAGR